ncbi:MAG: dTDP-4-dehydrorhamnose 3,5-epimerase [Terrimicrobiaceae bacterium]
MYLLDTEPHADKRGFFARLFSAREFRDAGLREDLTEVSLSRNLKARTLRGMHFQSLPHDECKLVRVPRGAIFDVAVDIRPDSPSCGQWLGVELSHENLRGLYIPRGFAHGFLTLENDTDVLYHITDTYRPEAATGFAWNDPVVGIDWPCDPVILSERDAALPAFTL